MYRKPFAGASAPVTMGILNVTPDSFSDGGRWTDVRTAVDHAIEMVEAGAGILGGCCGTTPEHIAYLYDTLGKVYPPHISMEQVRALTNERRAVYVDLDALLWNGGSALRG